MCALHSKCSTVALLYDSTNRCSCTKFMFVYPAVFNQLTSTFHLNRMDPGSFYIGINIDLIITKFYSILYKYQSSFLSCYTESNHDLSRSRGWIWRWQSWQWPWQWCCTPDIKSISPYHNIVYTPRDQWEREVCSSGWPLPWRSLIKLACVNCWISKCIDFPSLSLWGPLPIDPLYVHKTILAVIEHSVCVCDSEFVWASLCVLTLW